MPQEILMPHRYDPDGTCACEACMDGVVDELAELISPGSVAIQRLMDEVRLDQPTPHGLFDRAHNRHNRS